MSAPPGPVAGDPEDGLAVDGQTPSPFTLVGGDAALCEGDACALPSPAPAQSLRRSTTASAGISAETVAQDRTDGVTPSA